MQNVSAAWETNQQATICSQGKIRITLYNSSGLMIDQLTATDLISYTATERATKYTTSLPRNEYRLTFTIANNSHMGFVLNSIGKKTKVEYGFVIGNSVEYCDGGIFYVQTCKKQKGNWQKYDVYAVDILSTLTELYKGDSYPLPPDGDRSLKTMAKGVANSLGWVNGTDYDFDALDTDITHHIIPVIPYNTVFQLIANAAHKALFVDRQGKVWIDGVSSLNPYTLPKKVVYPYPRREEESYKRNVHVKVYTASTGSTVDVATYKFNTNGVTETFEIDFPECAIPNVYIKSGTGTLTTVSLSATHAVITLNCSSTVTVAVVGLLIDYSSREYNYQLYQYGDEDWYVDNVFVGDDTLAQRQTNIPQPGIKCELECRLNPALNVLDYVIFDTGGTYAMYFCIEEMTIIFNGGYKGILRGTM